MGYFILTHIAPVTRPADRGIIFAEQVAGGIELTMSESDHRRLNEPAQIQVEIKTYHEPITLGRGD